MKVIGMFFAPEYSVTRCYREGDQMDERIIEERINEMVKEIGSLPKSDNKKPLILSRKPAGSLKNKFRKKDVRLQDSLDFLRVLD